MSTATLIATVAAAAGMAAWPAASIRSAPDGRIPVRLILDQARYAPGANGRVRVQIGKDGYLLVLYAQPDGHVAIAFPIDPGVSNRVVADTEIEIRGRGNRDAFTVEDSSGSGTWYAAISSRPFRFDSVRFNGHWDYRAVPRAENPATVEADLTSFVEGMSTGRFDYDIVRFVIDTAAGVSSSSAEPTTAPSEPPSIGGPAGPTGPWWPGPWSGPGNWWPGWPGPWWLGPAPWPGPYYSRAVPGSGAPAAPQAPSASRGAGASTPPEAAQARGEGTSPRRGGSSGGRGLHL